MVTMVGTQSDLIAAIKDLIELDYDAVEAYEAALNRVDREEYKKKLNEFKADHERHIEELSTYLKVKNEKAPESGSMKQLLTQGKVVLGSMIGDISILQAMQSNESDTNTAYERMNQRTDTEEEIKDVLARGLEDEKKHYQWLQSVLEEKSELS